MCKMASNTRKRPQIFSASGGVVASGGACGGPPLKKSTSPSHRRLLHLTLESLGDGRKTRFSNRNPYPSKTPG